MSRALQAVRTDVQWLELAGRKGWLVVTRDRHISSRPAERTAAETFRVGMFVIRERRALNRWDLAKILVCHIDAWLSEFTKMPRPFIFEYTKRGDLRRTL